MDPVATSFTEAIADQAEVTDFACISTEEVRLLSSIGFMAAKSGYLIPAIRIFESLIVLRPGEAFPFIGMSIAYLAVGMSREAVHVLRDRAMSCSVDRAELGLWLSLAFQQAGSHSAAQKELDLSIRDQASDQIPALARTLAELLGGRPEVPTWPTPAPMAERAADFAAD